MNALFPLSWLYGAGVSLHRSARMVGDPPSDHPRIISIGNLEAGGNGKTPLAIWILARGAEEGKSCAYVSRGYGGATVSRHAVTCVLSRDAAPPSLANLRVLARAHSDLAHDVGDEGALVCERAPGAAVFFCADKRRAVDTAAASGVDIIVLDDAFQSWRVARHTDIVLLDAEQPLDGGALLPAGRLREKPDALARADAVVFNGAATPGAIAAARAKVERWLRPGTPTAGMGRRVELLRAVGTASPPPGPCLAVSAIARPGGFEALLKSAGVAISGHEVFSDHHRYDGRDVDRIVHRARRENAAGIVTTEKDWVKLRQFAPACDVWVARLEVRLTGDRLPV